MNQITPFTHEEFGSIRTLKIDGEPWFVGRDVSKKLGYTNSRKALADHVDKEDKGVTKCDTPGGTQQMTTINQSGLFSLILGSKLESAKRFKHWITSEVIPSIYKTGSYTAATSQPTIPEEDPKKWFQKMYPLYCSIEEYYKVNRRQLFSSIYRKLTTDYCIDIDKVVEEYKAKNNLTKCYAMDALCATPEYRDTIETILLRAQDDIYNAYNHMNVNILDRKGYR